MAVNLNDLLIGTFLLIVATLLLRDSILVLFLHKEHVISIIAPFFFLFKCIKGKESQFYQDKYSYYVKNTMKKLSFYSFLGGIIYIICGILFLLQWIKTL